MITVIVSRSYHSGTIELALTAGYSVASARLTFMLNAAVIFSNFA